MTVLAFFRPAWGVAVYMLTVFLCPPFWWWGDPIRDTLGMQLSIAAALIFAAAALTKGPRIQPQERGVFVVLLLYAISATMVHFALAVNPERSAKNLDLLWKNIGLLFLIVAWKSMRGAQTGS